MIRNLAATLLVLVTLSCLVLPSCFKGQTDNMIPYSEYMVLRDSLRQQSYEIQHRDLEIQLLRDSCILLRNRPMMTKDQFITLYRYDRLYKYYKICKGNPTQWKFYKGWSTRVFEGEEE